MDNEYLVIFCTVPDEDIARKISNDLVNEKLAACCNIVRGIRSIYTWKNQICDDSEQLLIIKTKKNAYKKLEDKINNIHPYDVPEIIAISIDKGSEKYLKWINENVK
jgi:periplasmic divalent cation tolerance protein